MAVFINTLNGGDITIGTGGSGGGEGGGGSSGQPAPWTLTSVGREFDWDQTKGRWVYDDGDLYGIYFDSSNSTWHFQSLNDEWTDVNTPIEAASDVLELVWENIGTITRPSVYI